MTESTDQGELAMAESLSCDLTVLSRDQRSRHSDLINYVLSSHLSVRELADGYEFTFKSEPEVFLKLSEWIVLERMCCPFLSFSIAYGRGHGPIALGVTGPTGAKELLKSVYPTKT